MGRFLECPVTPPPPDLPQRVLLHHGGPDTAWGNLGCWPPAGDPPVPYAQAAEALARRIGDAARLQPGERVLDIACGAGDSLRLWLQAYGVRSVHGLELDAAAVQAALAMAKAEGLSRHISVAAGSAMDTLPHVPRGFDAVLCVDAAYHLSPRTHWLGAVHAALRRGGRLAFTDLVLDRGRLGRVLLRGAARLSGVAVDDLIDGDALLQRLTSLGYVDVQIDPLDDAVLGGFVRFVQRQREALGASAQGAAWRRIAVTAALIPPCRAAGLGYALVSARKPSKGAGTSGPRSASGTPSSRATRCADDTALSSSGMPACA